MKGLEMEKEISTSNTLLSALLEKIYKNYSIHLQIVEIFGKRWSFIAGSLEEEKFLPPTCIKLCDAYGVVSNEWNRLTDSEKSKIISILKEALCRNERK